MLSPKRNHLFLAQNRRKPKTFQAPHYQRDPPGVHGEDDEEEDDRGSEHPACGLSCVACIPNRPRRRPSSSAVSRWHQRNSRRIFPPIILLSFLVNHKLALRVNPGLAKKSVLSPSQGARDMGMRMEPILAKPNGPFRARSGGELTQGKPWAMIGVGTKVGFAPPSEPDCQISWIRLSSWWLTFKKIGMPQCELVLRRTSPSRRSRYLASGSDLFLWPGLFVSSGA